MTNTNTPDATFISQTTTIETFSTVVRALWALQDGRFGVHTRLRLPAGSFHDEGWALFDDQPKAKSFATRPSY